MKKWNKSLGLVAVSFLIFSGVGRSIAQTQRPLPRDSYRLLIEPEDGMQGVINILGLAKSSINIQMFEIARFDVVFALKKLAEKGVRIRVLVEQNNLVGKTAKQITRELGASGIEVKGMEVSGERGLSRVMAFSIDRKSLFVSSITWNRDLEKRRDAGLLISQPQAVKVFDSLFEQEWAPTEPASFSPALGGEGPLVWSSGATVHRLQALLVAAKEMVIVSAEFIDEPEILKALWALHQRGVLVRIQFSRCPEGGGVSSWAALIQSGGVVRAKPGPPSEESPYVHQTLVVVDGESFFLGSQQLSQAGLTQERGLGVIWKDEAFAGRLLETFELDWSQASDCSVPAAN